MIETTFAGRTKEFMKENPRILENAVRNNIEDPEAGFSYHYHWTEEKGYDSLDLVVIFYYTFSDTSNLQKQDFLNKSVINSLAEEPDDYIAAKIANEINSEIYNIVHYKQVYGSAFIDHQGIIKTLARNLFYQTNSGISSYENLFSYDADVEIENLVTIEEVQAYWKSLKKEVS